MKICSIKENCDFKRLYYRGKSFVKKNVVLYCKKNRFNFNRLGLTVSPKVGNAVKRNRVRRILREIYRVLELEQGYDIVIVARKRSAEASFYEVSKDLKSALYDSGLLKRDELD